MERLMIAGGTRLKGEIRASGAKNAILPIMAAALLCPETCLVAEIPDLRDVQIMGQILRLLGARVELGGGRLLVEGQRVEPREVDEQLMRQLRASNLVLGPLLGRCGRARIAFPGGCDIGSRPMDLHTKGIQALGARVTERYGYLEAEGRLRGAEIHLDFPSVGATENLMMAAVLAEGTTIIRNAAKEPEIVDLQNFLNGMGARVRGAGLDTIRIDGVRQLHAVQHSVIPDRIEVGTHLVAGAITGGDLLVEGCIPEHVEPVCAKLREAGVQVEEHGNALRVRGSRPWRAVNIMTMPYPGFPTDMQPQMMALLSLARGTSVLNEGIFENRFKHVDELRRMGADIRLQGRVAVVQGVERLSGATVRASDLRAAAALVLAGMAAESVTIVEDVLHLDRGYEALERKYAAVGASIRRISVAEKVK